MSSVQPTKTANRLSVPPRHTSPPRALTEVEQVNLLRVADCLIPASGPNPKASDADQYLQFLNLALSARADVFDEVLAAVIVLADVSDDDLWGALKQMWSQDREIFDPLSSIVAGAYFMTPQIKELIGYPGQHRDVPGLEEAADELGTGILEPVLERGFIYVSAAGE
jgi:hypothetical protein